MEKCLFEDCLIKRMRITPKWAHIPGISSLHKRKREHRRWHSAATNNFRNCELVCWLRKYEKKYQSLLVCHLFASLLQLSVKTGSLSATYVSWLLHYVVICACVFCTRISLKGMFHYALFKRSITLAADSNRVRESVSVNSQSNAHKIRLSAHDFCSH